MSPVSGFSIISDQAAQTDLLDEEYVIGVELDGEARAYPTNAMGRPESELLNDTLAGRSIAVTFCVTCQSPLVFMREIAGQKLTLFLNGELLADNMIMKDVETGTEWVQLTGEAIHGPLKGHRLEQLPQSGPTGRPGGINTPERLSPTSLPSCLTIATTLSTRTSHLRNRSSRRSSGAWLEAIRPVPGRTHSLRDSPSSTIRFSVNRFSSCSTSIRALPPRSTAAPAMWS